MTLTPKDQKNIAAIEARETLIQGHVATKPGAPLAPSKKYLQTLASSFDKLIVNDLLSLKEAKNATHRPGNRNGGRH